KLGGATEIIFGAYGRSAPDFSELLLTGWMRTRHDKHHLLALAWQREQLRLSLEEILVAGSVNGAFRRDLDAGAVAAVMLGTAEGCLLQAATQGGAVPPGEGVKALLGLGFSGGWARSGSRRGRGHTARARCRRRPVAPRRPPRSAPPALPESPAARGDPRSGSRDRSGRDPRGTACPAAGR